MRDAVAAGEHGPWRAVVRSERMAEAEARIVESGSPADAAARFWRTVAATPLWERDQQLPGAWRATFLWRGAPETRHVALCGPVVFSERYGSPLEQIPGTDIWHLTLRFPPGTRSTYMISPDGLLGSTPEHDELARIYATWVSDPLNPSTFAVPPNAEVPEQTPLTLSLIEAPDAAPQPWSAPQPGIANGELLEYACASSSLGNTRRVWTYTAPGFDSAQREHHLLLAFDGWDAVNVTRLPVVLDNLVAARAIPPVAAVLVDSGTLAMRGRELDCHEPFLEFLTDELLPWARARWQLAPDRSRTLVAGISLGGRAALFAALRRPDVFGKVIAQSAAVTASRPLEELRHPKPARVPDKLEVYLDAGLLEIDSRGEKAFLPGVRGVRDMLRAAGHDVRHVELPCGHDDVVLGETVADGLRLLLTR